jgi:hypothetical protein
MIRTLEDTLVNSIQRAPCQPLAKLALADLLEEKSNSLEAGALRWCAENHKWPQRWLRVEDWGFRSAARYSVSEVIWQWWCHQTTAARRRLGRRCMAQPYAIVTEDISQFWSMGVTWAHPTWFAALTALGLVLKQLEEDSNANDQDEDGAFSAVGWSL